MPRFWSKVVPGIKLAYDVSCPEIDLKESPIAFAFFLQAGNEKKRLEHDPWKTNRQSISSAAAAIEMDHTEANSHFNGRRQAVGWTDFRECSPDPEELVIVRSFEVVQIDKKARSPGISSVEKPEKPGTGIEAPAVDRSGRTLRQFPSAVGGAGPGQFREYLPPVCMGCRGWNG